MGTGSVGRSGTARTSPDDFRRDRDARRKLGPEWHDWLDTYLSAVREPEFHLDALDGQQVAGERVTADLYRALDEDGRREVTGAMIDCVMVKPSRDTGRHTDPLPLRTRILWRGQPPDDLPRRRMQNVISSFAFSGEDEVAAGVLAAHYAA